MPAERLSMPKIREVLRLKHEAGLAARAIGRACGLSKSAVNNYIRLARIQGLGWPLPTEMDDAVLETRLKPALPVAIKLAPLNYEQLHQELKFKSMTLALLWEEYRQGHVTDGYGYSQFCHLYRGWLGCQKRSMRQTHKAGEKLFLDYSGSTVPVVVNRLTGEIAEAQIFVAVLGASNYTYAEATWSQQLRDWISSQVRAFEYFGGVPELVVPDNLKSAVSKACRYEPELNATTAEMVRHYGTAMLPARPYKPKDKAKVEGGVLLVQRWILARLRHQTFFSLAELNAAIRKLLEDLNQRPFKKLEGSRKSQFESIEKPALKPLPATRYEYALWEEAKVHIDYHIEIDKHYYSVPNALVGQSVDIRVGASVIEVFLKSRRVASHPRCFNQKHGHSTTSEHMPAAHRKHMEWSPGRFLEWGYEIGPRTKDLVRHVLENRPHPEHGYRSCLGLLSLAKKYGRERLEAACSRALMLKAPSYKSVKNILHTGLDRQPLPQAPMDELFVLPEHGNVRGPEYYT
jgi:transposase